MKTLEKIFSGTPAFPHRGVMLDISRDKVPTMDSLYALVDQLAAWRINHLQLYTEHTFAYTGHEVVWEYASPVTAAEIRELDAYCAARGVELVANQNSFGHLTRWLRHPAYQHLAECPEGYTTPWGERRRGPFSLNPVNPKSLELMRDLFGQLLPNFRSPLFNVNCDETFDLGQGGSKTACETLGKGRVYLQYLLAIKRLVEERGKTMMFWGDIILHHPELIPALGTDLIALVWGYEADHPFEEQCARFAAAGVPFWVCPGTSCWNSITGRLTNARANLHAAAEAGKRHGASGFLITEWGDNGHWQTWPFTRLALAAGAVTAWTGHAPGDETLASLVPDASLCIELGDLYLEAGFKLHNESPVFPLVGHPNPVAVLAQWSTPKLQRALDRVESMRTRINDDEIMFGATMLAFGLKRGLALAGATAPDRREDLRWIMEHFSRIWLKRNRHGGMSDSIQPLRDRQRELAITPSG